MSKPHAAARPVGVLAFSAVLGFAILPARGDVNTFACQWASAEETDASVLTCHSFTVNEADWASYGAEPLIETANTPELWNLHSVELRKGGTRIEDRSGWSLSSSVNRWELPFAFDRNLVSRWSTWQAAERGMFVQADFANPVEADSIQVLTPAGTRSIDVRVEICQQGRWQRVPARSTDGPLLNLRPAAVETMKKAGITHILTPAAYQGVGFLGERLINEADEWNLEVVANLYAIYLLKLR